MITGNATVPLPVALVLAALFVPAAQAQFVQQGPKLVAADAIGAASQGSAAALSEDGNTLVFGGPGDSNGFGAAWVYIRNGATWTEQAKLVPSNEIGNRAKFGAAVALSADGNTVIVGGPSDDNNNSTGASWVFVRRSGQWSQQAKLVGPVESSSTCAACHDAFKPVTAANYSPTSQGSVVSLSADGNVAIVGAPGDHYSRGSAWIYTRANGTWTPPAAPVLPSAITQRIGLGNVAVSGDGSTALVGASADGGGLGAAWVYAPVNGVWTQQAKLTAASGYSLGTSTALSYDGNTALLGARITQISAASGPNATSAAAAFTRTFQSGASIWTQQGGILVGVDAMGASSNPPVGLSGDGNTAIIGGPGDDSDYSGPGSAWVFRRYAGVWSQLGGKIVGSGYTGLQSGQGKVVAISGDGNSAIVGGPGDNASAGASWVWVYSYGLPPLLQQAKLNGNDATSADAREGYSLAISGDGKTVAVGGPGEYPVIDVGPDSQAYGAVWFYTLTDGAWTQLGSKLQVAGGNMNGINVGWCVGLTGDGKTALVGRWFGYGVSYVFTRDTAGTWTQQAMLGTSDPNPYAITQAPWSCAISGDGNTVIEGALEGAAYIFAYDGTQWTQQAYLVPSDSATAGSGRPFGQSVGISYDGNTVLIGGPNDNNNIGAAWVFTRDNTGTWTQQGSKLTGSDRIGASQQGASVALSGDGNTAIVGGPNDNSNIGAAWAYTRTAGVWTQQGGKLAAGEGGQGQGVAISQDGNTAAVGGINDDYTTGAVWTYRRNAGVWSQQGSKLVGSGAIGMAEQGGAIAMSADGTALVESGINDNYTSTHKSRVGAAWVFSTGTPQATHLAVSAPILAGGAVAFDFSVVALDSNNALVPGYTGPVYVSTSDGAGVVPQGNQAMVNGAAILSSTLNTAGIQTISVTDALNSSISGISGDIVVTPPPATHFRVTVPAATVRNTAFSFTVTALSAAGTTVASYSGTVHFSSSDSQATLPADVTLTNGTGSFSATLQNAGSQTITATDTAGAITGTSSTIAVALYSPCDFNQDQSVDMREVRIILDETMGHASAVHDMNADGGLNVVDLQIVMNAALGKGCSGS